MAAGHNWRCSSPEGPILPGMDEKSGVNRRRFISGGAAAGAALATGGLSDVADGITPRRPRRRRTRRVDVVIVGAGLAGLVAADRVRSAGKSVMVLEARDRVGGRILNHPIEGGEISEAGATFIGPTMNNLQAVADSVGVDTFPTYNEGENVYVAEGSRSTYSDTGPLGTAPPDPLIAADTAKAVTELNEMSKEVGAEEPWASPRAGEYDRQTLESWVRENTSNSERFRKLTAAATRPIFGTEPAELSLLFTLFYIAASGDEEHPGTFERNFNTRDGAQERRFVGGSQMIPIHLYRRLGGHVALRTPVRQIRHGRNGVSVVSDRWSIKAKRAIVAVPPVLAGRIDYEPNMPAERDAVFSRLTQGNLIKVAAVYDKPFWRDQGLNGTALHLDGVVNAMYDGSPPDGSPGVIFGFVGGDQARAFAPLSASERRSRVLQVFTDCYGTPAGSPRDYFETNWPADAWARGGPTAIAGPGIYTAVGPALRQPVGRIHWAGTETSTYWNGYMEGAVRSGQRAAHEVLAAL